MVTDLFFLFVALNLVYLQIILNPTMRQSKVNISLAIFWFLFGIFFWWMLREFRGELNEKIREFEEKVSEYQVTRVKNKTNNSENVDLEFRFNRKLKEIEHKVDYMFKEELIEWSKSLVKEGSKTFSQNDEDGVIEAVFEFIRTTDKVYVEFGVESCIECNSRYLR